MTSLNKLEHFSWLVVNMCYQGIYSGYCTAVSHTPEMAWWPVLLQRDTKFNMMQYHLHYNQSMIF